MRRIVDAILVRQTEDGALEIIDGHLRQSLDPRMTVPVLVLDVNQDEADKLLATLDRRRAMLSGLLRQRLPMITWHPPEATYLAWLNCAALGPDDQARERFLGRGHVALEPGLRFGAVGSGYARLNFATSSDILDLATARMAASLTDASARNAPVR